MYRKCEGNKWCGSAYEKAYREGYEQGYADGKKATLTKTNDDSLDKYLNERVEEVKGEENGN